jgi:hypothetical protein
MFIYLLTSSFVMLVTEFSPFLFEHYLLDWLPFLSSRYGKPILYLICGSFCFDSQIYHDDVPNFFAGVSLLVTGALWLLFYMGRVEASPSDYRGFQHPSTDLTLIIKSTSSSAPPLITTSEK